MTSRSFYPATHPNPHDGTNLGGVGGSGYPTQYSQYSHHHQQESQHDHAQSYQEQQQQPQRGGGSGLIRLTLRKPMGIVFEPLPPTPGQSQKGTGVRICDLPRTGAAYMSGRLEVGDELLSINDVTMSRLTFDQIMDFIINADPEGLRVLFRRPKKEDVHGTLGLAPSNSMTGNSQMNQRTSAVKWGEDEVVLEEEVKPIKQSRSKKKGKHGRGNDGEHQSSRKGREPTRHGGERQSNSRRVASMEEEDEDASQFEDDEGTLMSEDPSVLDARLNSKRNDKKSKSSGGNNGRSSRNRSTKQKMKVEESFLDLLINNICQVSSGKGFKKDEFSDDGVSYADTNTVGDEDTYADESTYADDPSLYSQDEIAKTSGKQRKATMNKKGAKQDAYDDDYTLETTDSAERVQQDQEEDDEESRFQDENQYDDNVPLGLAPKRKNNHNKKHPPHLHMAAGAQGGDINRMNLHEPPHNPSPLSQSYDGVNLPFRELECNQEAMDGGDVSVLTNNMSQYGSHISPQALVYAHSYVPEAGKTLEECIETNPERFYRHVVSEILTQNEPEKVRLLDKLLAKYQGREEHLIQKLTVRYRSGNHATTNEPSPLSQQPSEDQIPEQPSTQDYEHEEQFDAAQRQDLAEQNVDVDPWNTEPSHNANMVHGEDAFGASSPTDNNFVQRSSQGATPSPPQNQSPPGGQLSMYQTLGSMGTTDEQSPMSAGGFANPLGTTNNMADPFSPTAQFVPPPPPPVGAPIQKQQHHQNAAEPSFPNQGQFNSAQQAAAGEEVYYDDEPDDEEQMHGQDQHEYQERRDLQETKSPAMVEPQAKQFSSFPMDERNQNAFMSPRANEFGSATPGSSARQSGAYPSQGAATAVVETQQDFFHQQEEDVPQFSGDHAQQHQTDIRHAQNKDFGRQEPKSSPQGMFPQNTFSPQERGARTPGLDQRHQYQEEGYSEVDNETEGEDSAYTSEYSDSQGLDGTSPAVIAQVSELLNFVYGKTSVTGQIDRVSTIMRAYEGRENVLLELLETKALIKANQSDEPPPQGLIASAMSRDNSGDDYDDEDGGVEEHPDDISSVSGDDSRFNVKVPADSGEHNGIVSPMTHPSVETSNFAQDRMYHQQNQQNRAHQYQNNFASHQPQQQVANNQYFSNTTRENVRPTQQQKPPSREKENRGGHQGNSGAVVQGTKPRPVSTPMAVQQQQQQGHDKKKKGSLFGGLFKGKKTKGGKKEAGNGSVSRNNNRTGLSEYVDQEQEV